VRISENFLSEIRLWSLRLKKDTKPVANRMVFCGLYGPGYLALYCFLRFFSRWR
jgi:hypothetical protein